jgi:hypothetical protein
MLRGPIGTGGEPSAYMGMPATYIAIQALGAVGTPEALSELTALSEDPERGEAALRKLNELKSPAAARAAWEQYRTKSSTTLPTRPSRDDPKLHRLLQARSQLTWTISQFADAALRDEIQATIPALHWTLRPDARRMVREINQRLATAAATQPTTAKARRFRPRRVDG